MSDTSLNCSLFYFPAGYVMNHCSRSKTHKVYFSGSLLFSADVPKVIQVEFRLQLSPEGLLMFLYMCMWWITNTGLRWEHLCKLAFWCSILKYFAQLNIKEIFTLGRKSVWMWTQLHVNDWNQSKESQKINMLSDNLKVIQSLKVSQNECLFQWCGILCLHSLSHKFFWKSLLLNRMKANQLRSVKVISSQCFSRSVLSLSSWLSVICFRICMFYYNSSLNSNPPDLHVSC